FADPGRRFVDRHGRRPTQRRPGRVRRENGKNRLGKRRGKELAGEADDRVAWRAESELETLGQTGQLFDTVTRDGQRPAANLLPDAAGIGFAESNQRERELQ